LTKTTTVYCFVLPFLQNIYFSKTISTEFYVEFIHVIPTTALKLLFLYIYISYFKINLAKKRSLFFSSFCFHLLFAMEMKKAGVFKTFSKKCYIAQCQYSQSLLNVDIFREFFSDIPFSV